MARIMEQPVRIELTKNNTLAKLVNHYATRVGVHNFLQWSSL